MSAPPCRCHELRGGARGPYRRSLSFPDWRHGLYLFGHHRECPQRGAYQLPGRFDFARPLVRPRTVPVGKRRDRRGQTRPR